MAAEKPLQDPTTFQEISVSVTEENEFFLDPSLLALSGNNIQQYCTMLSLMEFQNIKGEMVLKTEQGEMPLSLVTVSEEYEVVPWTCEDNESMPFDLPQPGTPGPQVRIQYEFVSHSKDDILQGNGLSLSKPEQGTNLRTSETGSIASGGNLSTFSKIQKVHLQQGLMGNPSKVFVQEKWKSNKMDFTEGQGSIGLVSQQNNTPNTSGLVQPPGNDLRPAGHCVEYGVGDVSTPQITFEGERNRSCNQSGESVSEQPFSVVPERWQTGGTLCSCPNCGRALSLNGNPATQKLSHTGERLSKCPSCGHFFSCNTPRSAERPQVTLTDDCERLFSQLDLNPHPVPKKNQVEKPFHCPDCGAGFLHKSSIPRHQKIHQKENLSYSSGQETSSSPAGSQLGSPKAPPKKKLFSCPDGRSHSADKNDDMFAALCEVCGQSFSLVQQFLKHRAIHSAEKPFSCCHCGKRFSNKSVLVTHLHLHRPERPFPCPYCEKSYIQRSHLGRHCQKHHSVSQQSKEGWGLSVGLPQTNVPAV